MAGMLTTVDNPFSPFDQWEQWDAFDRGMGYHSCAYLARVIGPTSEMSTEADIERGMSVIVQQDPLEKYEIVFPRDFEANSERYLRFVKLATA